ncbi:MAG: hypothetical protein ACRDXX_21605 [Stackebrandtia sp.]
MKRWIPAAAVGVGLFLFNVATRLVMELTGKGDDTEAQTTVGLYATGAMAVVALIAGAWWAMRKPMDRIVAELGLALLGAALFSTFLAPLVTGGNPVAGGVAGVLTLFLFFLGGSVVAGFVGYLLITVVGVDYRSKNLKAVERHYGRRERSAS